MMEHDEAIEFELISLAEISKQILEDVEEA